ncbi:ATP-binding protein [Streptomyces avermitilis]|uniref:ATP-binding protein n=1 Tax=Streptomyces avermitilis TaxID=33903 RepID=UPI0033FCC570
MPLEVNRHVQRIRRYQPFDVDSSEMIYEQADRTQSLFPVVTLDYLLNAIERPTTKTIVLTGDAGHGKTSLCASLLAKLQVGAETNSSDVRKAVFRELSVAGDASRPIGQTRSGRPLYILRDLSEINLQAGARKLVELLDPPDKGVAIICANEGQLRKCVAEDENLGNGGTGRAKILVKTLTEGIVRGQVSAPDGAVTVINLNYQSVAADDSPNDGLIHWVLKQWTTTQWTRWKPCETCDARDVCPILANRNELSDPTRGPQRRAAIRDLFAAAERTGAVVTTRQALSVTSYMLTGGLSCENVHAKYQRSHFDTSWQAPHLYHQALFGDRLTQQQRHLVPAFFALRKLDPGKVSRRRVDDRLDPDTAGRFAPADPSSNLQKVRTTRDVQKQADQLRGLYTFLRRADFFNSDDNQDRFARMGLQAGDDFVSVQDKNRDLADTTVRDRFLKGLEAVQGIHRAGSNPDFFLLDPAFFTHRARAAVISRRVPSKGVKVVDQITQWQAEGIRTGVTPEMQDAVEWLNRAIYIRIPAVNSDQDAVSVEADLLRFELLTRWAAGLRSEVQHEAEIRGLSGSLAELADSSNKDDEIQVLVGNVMRKLMIDVGDKIRSVRA